MFLTVKFEQKYLDISILFELKCIILLHWEKVQRRQLWFGSRHVDRTEGEINLRGLWHVGRCLVEVMVSIHCKIQTVRDQKQKKQEHYSRIQPIADAGSRM